MRIFKKFLPIYHIIWALYLVASYIAVLILSENGYEPISIARYLERNQIINILVFLLISTPIVFTPFFSQKTGYFASYGFLVLYGFLLWFSGSISIGAAVAFLLLAISFFITDHKWLAGFSVLTAVLIVWCSFFLTALGTKAEDKKLSESIKTKGQYSLVFTEYDTELKYHKSVLRKNLNLGIVSLEKNKEVPIPDQIDQDDVYWTDKDAFHLKNEIIEVGEMFE